MISKEDVLELKNLVKRLKETQNFIDKEENAQRKKELNRSFAALAEQFKKKASELSLMK